MRMRPLPGAVAALALLGSSAPVLAITAVDLSSRLVIDGFTGEWEFDESLFHIDSQSGQPEEPSDDSAWGPSNDLRQIRVTWDARHLYLAADAVIWGNNTMLLLDLEAGGLPELTNLNAWRRNAVFGNGIEPDLFLATWDGNTQPQLWRAESPGAVSQVPAEYFSTIASFSQGATDRSMEACIPWDVVFEGRGTSAFDASVGDTVYVMPEGVAHLRLVGWITAGPDGTGGPDSAPDNTAGHVVDSAALVVLDNYAIVTLDQDGDRVADFGADVKARTAFFIQPVSVERETWGATKGRFRE